MPRRPIAKKAPAKRKAQQPDAKATYFAATERAEAAAKARIARLKALEDKVVEQAEYITKQERMIARLLSLLNDKGP
jgi:hypothetical protein